MDWGCSAPTVAYLCLPDPEGAPKGSIWLLDEFYVAASTAGGQRDWTRGTHLSNAEQATGIIEWLSRWNLRPGATKVVADDAVFNATGSDRGSTAGDLKAAGCPLVRAGKMNLREANGLALVQTMLQLAGRDAETPWFYGRGHLRGRWRRGRRGRGIHGMWRRLLTVVQITALMLWVMGCSSGESGRPAEVLVCGEIC